MRAVVCDDDELVRELLASALTHRGVEVVGEAADGAAAVAVAEALRPDVVLMDLRMPGVDGVEATRLIGERVPGDVATYYRDGNKIHSFKEGRWNLELRAEFFETRVGVRFGSRFFKLALTLTLSPRRGDRLRNAG